MTNEQAINELKDWQTAFSRMDKDMSYAIEAFGMAIEALSAELDNNSTEVDNRNDELSCSENPNTCENTCDFVRMSNGKETVYRKDMIEMIQGVPISSGTTKAMLMFRAKELPSAQPEIIRCKDCYHYPDEHADCPMIGWARNENDFCSKAERKDDE